MILLFAASILLLALLRIRELETENHRLRKLTPDRSKREVEQAREILRLKARLATAEGRATRFIGVIGNLNEQLDDHAKRERQNMPFVDLTERIL